MHQLLIKIYCKIIITSTSRWLPNVRLLQPLDISHWILLQLHSPWQFLPYEGYGHLEEQFYPVYPDIHSINPSKSKYYVNIFYSPCKNVHYLLVGTFHSGFNLKDNQFFNE